MTAVYSCVRILAEAVAGLPLNLYRYTEDGGKEDNGLAFGADGLIIAPLVAIVELAPLVPVYRHFVGHEGVQRHRDAPQNSTAGSAYTFFFGGTTSGKAVTERSAMQMTFSKHKCLKNN